MSSFGSPPTGTVTFLFTDIEGSTKRWEAHPDTMRTALARHDANLRAPLRRKVGMCSRRWAMPSAQRLPTPRTL